MNTNNDWPKLQNFIFPAKTLVTAILLVMGIAMVGAGGQIIIHDIIPTFVDKEDSSTHMGHGGQVQNDDPRKESSDIVGSGPGDLFGDISIEAEATAEIPFYKTEQFVWILKWTHIHLFGMNMIFIFMGCITLFLNLSHRVRTWLVILPFVGVTVDILAVWVKIRPQRGRPWKPLKGDTLPLPPKEARLSCPKY